MKAKGIEITSLVQIIWGKELTFIALSEHIQLGSRSRCSISRWKRLRNMIIFSSPKPQTLSWGNINFVISDNDNYNDQPGLSSRFKGSPKYCRFFLIHVGNQILCSGVRIWRIAQLKVKVKRSAGEIEEKCCFHVQLEFLNWICIRRLLTPPGAAGI